MLTPGLRVLTPRNNAFKFEKQRLIIVQKAKTIFTTVKTIVFILFLIVSIKTSIFKLLSKITYYMRTITSAQLFANSMYNNSSRIEF